MTAQWSLQQRDGLTLVECAALSAVPGVGHLFSTRCADGSGLFDLGGANQQNPEFAHRRRRLAEAANLSSVPTAPSQVHGIQILDARDLSPSEPQPSADAIVSERRNPQPVAAAVRTADCVPILMADESGRAVAAVHAGWRGTAAGIAGLVVKEFERRGIPASALIVALGPAIGVCCYEVGDEVRSAIELASGSRVDGRFVDLHAVNAQILQSHGVRDSSITAAPWCTQCHPELFFSHRGDPAGAGRMLSTIAWRQSNGGVP